MSISEHFWRTFSINKEPIRETQGDNEINIEGEHNVWARLRLVNPMKPKNLLNAVYQENEQSLLSRNECIGRLNTKQDNQLIHRFIRGLSKPELTPCACYVYPYWPNR